MNAQPKLRLENPMLPAQHRSGWQYALNALAPLLTDDGIYFDDFAERSFLWHRHAILNTLPHPVKRWLLKRIGRNPAPYPVPFTRPWIGFVHNPPTVPALFGNQGLDQLVQLPEWQQSLQQCRGLITLSSSARDYLEQYVDVPVLNLIHPTDTAVPQFSLEQHQAKPTLVQIGWWLRRQHSLYQLNTPGINRIHLDSGNYRQQQAFQKEAVRESPSDVTWQTRLSAAEYDQLLQRSVVFLDLYDSSANNTIVECIARSTPVLVNRLPATEEYLGNDYPLLYESLDEASQYAQDNDRIRTAQKKLLANPIRNKLRGDYFCRSLAESTLYQNL